VATENVIVPTQSFTASRAGAYVALLAGIFCIAWSAIFVRWTNMPGTASAFYRMLIPSLILLPTYFFDRFFDRERKSINRRTLGIIALGGFFFSLDLALYNSAILKTTAANATVLGNNTPIFVGLITWLIFRRRPTASFWTGLLLAVAGSFVLVWGDLMRHVKLGLGDVMALAAAACFAVYLMATEEVRTTTGTLAFLRLAIFSSTISLLLMNLVMGTSLRVPNARSWAALFGLGLVSQLGGYLALTYAMGRLPATMTSVSLLTQVPLTAVLAALLLAEPLTLPQIMGGVLVLSGVGLAHREKHPEDEVNV
jgi:drug/metabolite transporter (DMT)-like permease